MKANPTRDEIKAVDALQSAGAHDIIATEVYGNHNRMRFWLGPYTAACGCFIVDEYTGSYSSLNVALSAYYRAHSKECFWCQSKKGFVKFKYW